MARDVGAEDDELDLESLLLVVHLIVAVAVCGLVLLQHGKGADMGAAFGSGSSGSLFGAAGLGELPVADDGGARDGFFVTSLGLTYLGSLRATPQGVMQQGVMETAASRKATCRSAAPPTSPATRAQRRRRRRRRRRRAAKAGEVPK